MHSNGRGEISKKRFITDIEKYLQKPDFAGLQLKIYLSYDSPFLVSLILIYVYSRVLEYS